MLTDTVHEDEPGQTFDTVKKVVRAGRQVNVLGVNVSVANLDEAVAMLRQWRDEGRREYVCCVSVHGIVTAQRDPAIRAALNGAGLATKDGMPLAWWSRRAGVVDARRVCGSDLMDAMCGLGAQLGHRHYFYGGTSAVLEGLVACLQVRHPGLIVAGHRAPPFRPLTETEDAADVQAINDAHPDFVWIGLGMPKQEKWMAAHQGRVHATAMLGVGAAFDFHAGVKRRAPGWMQHSGLEWLFRLATEPRRLARRYLVDNVVFIGLTVRHLTGIGAFPAD